MRRILFVLTVGMGLLALMVGLVLVLGRPRVVGFWPEAGAGHIPSGAPLHITFSRPMQADSVTERFHIEPQQAGELNWEGNTLTFTPRQPWASGITVTVQLEAGAQALGLALPSADETRWAFSISQPVLAYLFPADGPADLYALDVSSGQIAQLTHAGGVQDFSASADGMAIYYSAAGDDARFAHIYRLDRLSEQSSLVVRCVPYCQSVALSPDGKLLAYESLAAGAPGQVWLLPLPDGTPYLAGEASHTTSQPQWAANGWLAFYDATDQAYILLDPPSGESRRFANQTGDRGSWAPDGSIFSAAELLNPAEIGLHLVASSHLMRYDLRQGPGDLTQSDLIEDTAPAFSPDGSGLLFARRYLDDAHWTPGRQIWYTRPDGSQIHALTDEPFWDHHDFVWYPDGSRFVCVRYNQAMLATLPELWLFQADGSQPVQLVIGGYAPQWLP